MKYYPSGNKTFCPTEPKIWGTESTNFPRVPLGMPPTFPHSSWTQSTYWELHNGYWFRVWTASGGPYPIRTDYHLRAAISTVTSKRCYSIRKANSFWVLWYVTKVGNPWSNGHFHITFVLKCVLWCNIMWALVSLVQTLSKSSENEAL